MVIQSDARLESFGQAIYQNRTQYLENVGKLLKSYSYKGVLERGFAVVRDRAGAPVTAAGMLAPGDNISLSFKDDGRAEAVVSSVGTETGTPTQPKKPTAKKRTAPKRGSPSDDSQGSLL